MAFVAGFPSYLVVFLHDVVTVPHVYYAVVVAVFFGLATVSRPGLLMVPLIAAIVYIASLALGPVLFYNGKLVVPGFDIGLAKELLAAYLLFLLADAIVFAIKKYAVRVIG